MSALLSLRVMVVLLNDDNDSIVAVAPSANVALARWNVSSIIVKPLANKRFRK